MRLWLRDAERKPDPDPVQTDDRKAVFVGLVLWLIALVLLLVFVGHVFASPVLVGHVLAGNSGWLIWTAVTGCALGVLGLVILQFKRR
ncbi:MAG: DUF2530 domain-containing protein [Microbacteriaceae bacterium]|nr:MAG: DUF2530 domain-containing protein [Microbacteriaceae bacterium]